MPTIGNNQSAIVPFRETPIVLNPTPVASAPASSALAVRAPSTVVETSKMLATTNAPAKPFAWIFGAAKELSRALGAQVANVVRVVGPVVARISTAIAGVAANAASALGSVTSALGQAGGALARAGQAVLGPLKAMGNFMRAIPGLNVIFVAMDGFSALKDPSPANLAKLGLSVAALVPGVSVLAGGMRGAWAVGDGVAGVAAAVTR